MGLPRAFPLALVAALAAGGAPGAAHATDCKLALVLGLDISSSVNSHEYDLQLQGLAQAFRTPEIIDAILTPEGAGIAVTVYEWSGYNQQDVVIPWTMIDTREAALDLAARLAAHRRPYADLTTALGKAVEYGAGLFRKAPDCGREVIDISGDGENNDGDGPEVYRAQGLLDGIIINGLAIQGAFPDPALYYRDHVIQGPGAFLATARDFNDYPAVVIGKLLREIDQEMIIGAGK
jgi:Ca-activated chloride channel family protein